MRISDWSSDVCSSDLAGQLKTGHIEGGSTTDVIGALQRQGLRPIHMAEVPASANGPAKTKVGKASRQIIAKAIGELGVLLGAGLTLYRALAVVVDNSRSEERRDGKESADTCQTRRSRVHEQ